MSHSMYKVGFLSNHSGLQCLLIRTWMKSVLGFVHSIFGGKRFGF